MQLLGQGEGAGVGTSDVLRDRGLADNYTPAGRTTSADLLKSFNQGGDKIKGTKAAGKKDDNADDLDKLILMLVGGLPGGQLLSMIGKGDK